MCLLGGTLWHNAQLGAANIQLNDALLTSEKRRLDADTNLYHSLVGEARALRRARDNGYRGEIFKRLAHALQLRTPDKDPLDLRQEAAACLGDFVGFDPVIWEDFPTGMECAALHPDGTELAVGLVDGTVVLRHIPSGAHLTRLTGHVSAVSFVTFRADGKELISTDLGGMIKVWHANDTGTWTCTRTTLVEPLLFLLTPSLTFPYFTPSFTVRTIDSAGLTPDGQYMAVSCVIDSTIILVDLAKGTTAARFVAPEGEQIWTLALSPDGKVLAGGYAHQGTFGVLLWDVATGALVRRLLPNLEQTIEVRFSPNGKLLACLHSEGLALYDTSSFQHPQFVRGDLPYSIAFSPDSHVLAIDVWQLGLVRLWNVYTSRETAALRWQGTKLEKPSRDSRSWHGPRMLKAMEFSKDGKIFVAATGYSVHLWNLAGGSEKLVLRGHAGGVPDVVFSPDGKLLASAGKDHTIKIWDPVAGTLLKTLTEFSTPVQTLGFSPDGRILAAGDFERDTVRFYDVPSWKELAVMHPQVGSIVASVGFSPDGKYFAAAGWTGLTLWRIVPGKTDQSGESKFTLQHHGRLAESPSVSVCFSADSNWLAWLSWDEAEDKIRYGQIHFTDLRSPQPRRLSAAGSWNGVLALGFYPDCQHLVFVSDKRAITVWDVSSNQESFSFGKEELERLSTKPVARLSADGAWYAMGSQTVTIWDMRTRKLLVALPEERSAVSSVGWSPNRELLAVGTFGGGPIIWNLSKVKAKLDEIGLGW